jgi:ABC-type multidrug transport system ATPase subunit
MNYLQIDSVIKSYGHKVVLSDIYLKCRPGEIIGLLGRNGSGKSTLFQIIFGSLKADQKFIKSNGTQIFDATQARNHIAYLPQHGLIPTDIRVNTAIQLFTNGQANMIFKQFPLLETIKNQKAGKLSHGEKRLLEIIVILHSPATYILLDEPFNGLSPLMKEEVSNIVRNYPEKGFIISDHDYRNVLKCASRLFIILDGKIREIENEDELKHWAYLPD